MENIKIVDNIVLLLLIIGALNWGLVAFLDFNLVARLLGEGTVFARVAYALVAAAGVYAATWFVRDQVSQ
ncbi:MAG: DUF378 domain-containing protein [Candidatus Babeliales bacterium]|nr:DUF378 domain-containing protein [Candidatus Babeliales bacterium]